MSDWKYHPDFASDVRLDDLLTELEFLPRTTFPYSIYGQTVLLPRDICVYGEYDADGRFPRYRYGTTIPEQIAFPPMLRDIRDRIRTVTGQHCNHVIVNRYNDGADYIGYHHDKTGDFVDGTSVCTVSLGAERRFVLRREMDTPVFDQPLADGSLFVLGWGANRTYKHAIAKTAKPVGMRVSLTFRCIKVA